MFMVLFIIAFSLFSLFFLTGFWKRTSLGRKYYKSSRRSPLKGNLLREPGEDLNTKLTDALLDGMANATILYFSPFLLLGVYFLTVEGPSLFLKIFFAGIGVSSFCYYLLKIRKNLKLVQDLRLGLDGEIATAQALDILKQSGYYVYHDFPANDFNIDHVVIGPSGVYAVETKTRSKSSESGIDSAHVYFSGDVLEFPRYKDTESIKQALGQAKWLSDFLKKSVGKVVFVKPVLTLPGWFINRPTNDFDKLMVINPKEAIVIAKEKQILDDQTIEQIKFQVEQQCRTVKPFHPL